MEKKYEFHNHHERTRRDKFNNLIKVNRQGKIYGIKCNSCGSWLSVKAHKAHIMDKNMEIGVVCNFCIHFNKIDLDNPFNKPSPEEIELEKQNTINSIRGFIDL